MKKTALIYALWEKNLAVLQVYLQTRSRVVLVPDYFATDALRKMVEASGSELCVLPMGGSEQCVDAAEAVVEAMRQGPKAIGLQDDTLSHQITYAVAEDVAREMPVIQAWLKQLDNLADQYDVEITVLNEDVMRDGKVLALWSRHHQVPVLQLAHGTGMGRDYIGESILSDHIAVPSQRSAEYFQDLGMPANHIHVVGNPHWDMIAGLVLKRDEVRATLAQTYQLSLSGQWIVWASTWNASLSALDDRDIVNQMVHACQTMAALKISGLRDVTLIFKDRLVHGFTYEQMQGEFIKVATALGVAEHVRYVTDDARYWAACGDVVISYDSNISLEAVLANVPAINLITEFGAIAGGSFGADDGVLSLNAEDLVTVLLPLCTDAAFRQQVIEAASTRKEYFHAGADGQSAMRLADLIGRCARQTEGSSLNFVWQKYLDFEHSDVGEAYHTIGRQDLANMYTNSPHIALDIGCAAGSNGLLIKQRFPQSQVWGIETNRAAAALAQQKLDKVLVGMFEDFDLEREGIAKGSLDAVLLADVLEHMYNPWDVMVKLRPFMSETGQLVLSIPNVRNMVLMDDLSKGNWTYRPAGLLDITHIRFFTYKEVLRFCRETGYRVIKTLNAIDPRLDDLLKKSQGSLPGNIETERLVFKNVTPAEMLEMCSLQFYVLLEKDPLQG